MCVSVLADGCWGVGGLVCRTHMHAWIETPWAGDHGPPRPFYGSGLRGSRDGHRDYSLYYCNDNWIWPEGAGVYSMRS